MKKIKNYKDFLSARETSYASWERLRKFGDEYLSYKKKYNYPLKILDIGCGKNAYLIKYKDKNDKYYGCDFYINTRVKLDGYFQIDLNRQSIDKKIKKKKFDVIFCGEVIEHLFSPDDLLEEIRSLMHKKSILILSTPNLGYYVNRIMLLFGISPLFLENSSYRKLGRVYEAFGQGNKTEGHIRLFTFRALKDLLKMKKYKIVKIIPVSIWKFWPDKIFMFFFKSLASDNIFILRK